MISVQTIFNEEGLNSLFMEEHISYLEIPSEKLRIILLRSFREN